MNLQVIASPGGDILWVSGALRGWLTSHPDVFVGTVTEKLLTYALGRGLEPYDMPIVRGILRNTAANQYRMQSIILGIVESRPFQMRTKVAQNAQEAH